MKTHTKHKNYCKSADLCLSFKSATHRKGISKTEIKPLKILNGKRYSISPKYFSF